MPAVAADDVAYINSKILTWALDRSRMSRSDVAAKVKVSELVYGLMSCASPFHRFNVGIRSQSTRLM